MSSDNSKESLSAPLIEKETSTAKRQKNPYEVSLSHSFVFLLLIGVTLVSFHIGVVVRERMSKQPNEAATSTIPTVVDEPWIQCNDTSQDFLCNSQLRRVVDEEEDDSSDSDSDDDDSNIDSDSDSDDDDDDDGEHERVAFGQHLLADVSAMEQETVVSTVLELANSQGWILRSHHCTSTPCVLLFEQGHHIILHQQSHQLDIYTTDADEPLLDWLDSLPLIEKWASKQRGRDYDPTKFDAGLSDMNSMLLGSMGFASKRLVAQDQSPFQQVTIYDVVDPGILDGRTKDRHIYLDGVVQSRSHGERAYHEALVHPAMIMHPNPRRVAIVGAGEGATLREVLKHTTLEQVIMIEIDPYVMNMSKEYLPEWNDCSDLALPEGMVNPTGNCFDDPRAIVYAEDAIAWFMNRYPENGTIDDNDLFDVIIMDALDPGESTLEMFECLVQVVC